MTRCEECGAVQEPGRSVHRIDCTLLVAAEHRTERNLYDCLGYPTPQTLKTQRGFVCPYCGAHRGEFCRTAIGTVTRNVHRARIDRWARQR